MPRKRTGQLRGRVHTCKPVVILGTLKVTRGGDCRNLGATCVHRDSLEARKQLIVKTTCVNQKRKRKITRVTRGGNPCVPTGPAESAIRGICGVVKEACSSDFTKASFSHVSRVVEHQSIPRVCLRSYVNDNLGGRGCGKQKQRPPKWDSLRLASVSRNISATSKITSVRLQCFWCL